MKKVKIVFWLLLLALLAGIVYQNQQELMKPLIFHLDPGVVDPYQTPAVPLVVILAGLFLLGLLIAYFYSLYGYFRQAKTIKHLHATVAAQTEEIETLRRQVKNLDRPSAAPVGAPLTPTAVDA